MDINLYRFSEVHWIEVYSPQWGDRTSRLYDIANKAKGKGKGHHRTDHEGPEREQRHRSTLSLTSALDVVGGKATHPRPLYSRKTEPVPIV